MNDHLIIDKDLEVSIESISQWRTYSNQMEGAPGDEMNAMEMRSAVQKAKAYGCINEAFLIKPVAAEPVIGEGSVNPSLPKVTCVARLKTHTAFKDRDKDYSLLAIVWFQEEFAFPIDEVVLEAIREIPYRELCVEFEY